MTTSKTRIKYEQRYESISRVHKLPIELVEAIYKINAHPQSDILIHLAKKIYQMERNQKEIMRFLDGMKRTITVGTGMQKKWVLREFVGNGQEAESEFITLANEKGKEQAGES